MSPLQGVSWEIVWYVECSLTTSLGAVAQRVLRVTKISKNMVWYIEGVKQTGRWLRSDDSTASSVIGRQRILVL